MSVVPYTDPLGPGEAAESWRNAERWAMIRNPVPGRTLDEVYSVVGQVLQTHANRAAHRLGLGPNHVAGKITSFFGTGEERQLRLIALWDEIPEKLERYCFRLMEYTLPTESSTTQCQAFERIVTLTTRFPGLRFIFLRSKCIQDVPVLVDSISALWDRSDDPTDPYWSFWRTFTATCLAETSIAVMLEETPVSQLATYPEDSGSLSLIERLLVAHRCETDADSAIPSALCIRYLAGMLELPGFWMNMGSVHSDVTRKLCVEMVLVLRDMSIDILPSEEFPRSEAPFDYDGVDLLADAILVGISSWLKKINPTEWALQSWYLCLVEVVHLLRGPTSAALLPKSFSRATSNSFEKDIPTIYREVELDVMVETSIKTIPPHVPGFGLYYSEHVAGSEKKAAPSVPQDNNSGVSFSDAKRTRQFNIVLEVIDSAGSEYFSFGNEVYMKSADGFILAFSLTQEYSLKEVETLRDQIYLIRGHVPIVAVGLKSDLLDEREVDAATIKALSSQWNIPFYEASAKLKWHVDDVLRTWKRGKRRQGPCIIM
ncbi:ras family-domain-containing protein [Mycena rebaudengoi]|nr:ras family-domain-containing protein [Mycena rebaudengoi]